LQVSDGQRLKEPYGELSLQALTSPDSKPSAKISSLKYFCPSIL
jgi:hypothetical protein